MGSAEVGTSGGRAWGWGTGWMLSGHSVGDALTMGLRGALASLEQARLRGVVTAALQVPLWEYALLMGAASLLVLLWWMEVDPLRSLVGDAPTLEHHPKSPTARLIQEQLPIPRFWPTPWLCSPHLQTMFLHFFVRSPQCPYRRQLVTTPDGGTLALDWLDLDLDPSPDQAQDQAEAPGKGKGDPASTAGQGSCGSRAEEPGSGADASAAEVARGRGQGSGGTPIAIIVPGLSSDSESQYVKHCAVAVGRLGWRVVVVNHRGLGGVKITSRKMYNAGWTEDMHFVVGHLAREEPCASLYAIGTSMGGNILVKFLGEAGAQSRIRGAAIVGCPWDLLICDRWMNRRLPQRMYNAAMAFSLKAFAMQHRDALAQMVCIHQLTKSRSIRQFDDYVTRVIANYETVDTYYRRSSSAQFLPRVAVPVLCISALDDPICTREALPWAEARSNPNVVLLATHHGGHLAYLQGLTAGTIWWTGVAAKFLQIVAAQASTANQEPSPPLQTWAPRGGPPREGPVFLRAGMSEEELTALGEEGEGCSTTTAVAEDAGGPWVRSSQAPAAGPCPDAPHLQLQAQTQMHTHFTDEREQSRGGAVAAGQEDDGHCGPSSGHSSEASCALQVQVQLPAVAASPVALALLEDILRQLLLSVQHSQHMHMHMQMQMQHHKHQQQLQPQGAGAKGAAEGRGLPAGPGPAPGLQGLLNSAEGQPPSRLAQQDTAARTPALLSAHGPSNTGRGQVAAGAAGGGGPAAPAKLADRTLQVLLEDLIREQRSSAWKHSRWILLLHAAVAVAGPLAATAVALRLHRSGFRR